jgi:hypothetical protein
VQESWEVSELTGRAQTSEEEEEEEEEPQQQQQQFLRIACPYELPGLYSERNLDY